MNYRGLILLVVIAMLFFSSCRKDAVDYKAYNVTHNSHTADTTKAGDTTGTGGTTGPGGTGDTTGTPDDPGTRPDDPDNPDNPRNYYFKGTLNGKKLTWGVTDNSSGWVIGVSSRSTSDMGVYTGSLTALLSASEGFKPQLGVEFRTMKYNFDEDKTAYLKNFLTTGAWPLAANNDFTVGVKRLTIHYTDAAGKEYSSAGTQSGAAPNVSAVTYIPPGLGVNDAFKIKLTLTCTLYPVNGSGASLSLTNGEAVVRLENTL